MSINYNLVGQKPMGTDHTLRMMIGANDYTLLNAFAADVAVSTADATYWGNCRGFSVDVAGIVKIDYVNDNQATVTEVLNVPGDNIIVPIRNIRKLYRYYVGTTLGTVSCWGSDGVAITNAIKLRR